MTEETTFPTEETTIPTEVTTAPTESVPVTEPPGDDTGETVPLETIPGETLEIELTEPEETVQTFTIEDVRQIGSDIVHADLFGSFLVCGTLMGIAFCWRFTK